MALVEAGSFYNGVEAAIAQSRLSADGIDSFIFDAEMNWGGGLHNVVPVRLMVEEEDEGLARQILAEGGK